MSGIIEKFKPVFYPDSIAVVGASKDTTKVGTKYFRELIKAGFKGRLYPVNVSDDSVPGFKAYPRVSSIPDPVDYVIIAVPARYVIELIDDCIAKKVKTVQLFTAGFRELGTPDGVKLEQSMLKKATAAGVHIIGPNCIGICNPSANIPFGPTGFTGKPGTFGFISQSGGHGISVLSGAAACGIRFSKAVSFGNGGDLDSADFLEYLAADEDTRILGAYLEGVNDGRRIYRLIKEITRSKPVIIWKGGRTSAGAQTAASHTGSLASPYAIWSSAVKQAGAVSVESMEEFIDTALAFYQIRYPGGRRVAVIAGIVDGGGGDCVSATDSCTSIGIEVPPFSPETRVSLTAILPGVGTIFRNPLDLGFPGANFPLLTKVVELVAGDPNIDLIIIQKHVDMLLKLSSYDNVKKMNSLFIDWKNSIKKPIIIVSSPGMREAERLSLDSELSEAGVPVFLSVERAARALLNLNLYYEYIESNHRLH